MYDLLIKNGEVIDGSGRGAVRADIAVKDGEIKRITAEINKESRETIDAAGLVVSPGFIDIHSHSDFTLLINPKAESKVRQGITTELVGNCGFTAAPVRRGHFAELMQYLVNTVILDEGEKSGWTWESQAGFLKQIKDRGTAVNIASLVGHGTLRTAVMGFARRQPTGAELNTLKKMLAEELEEGIFGLSTGLQYEPGSFAAVDELVELNRIVARYGGIYTTHLKSEGDYLLQCIEEALEIAQQSGVSLEISHLKASGSSNWSKIRAALKLINDARQRGMDVNFDVYPYTAFGSGLIDLVPPWIREAGANKMVELLEDRAVVERVIAGMKQAGGEWENPMADTGWDKVLIASLRSVRNRVYEGLNLEEIAEKMGLSPCEAVIRLLKEEKGAVKMIFFAMQEEDVITLMKEPLALFSTDGRAVADYGRLGEGRIHPRYYGTYPRILGYFIREKKILSLEEAVSRMTFLPAQKLNIQDRGLLKEGYKADITIFDRERVIDRATFKEPHQYPAGIEYVIVNGTVVVSEEEHTGALPGEVLKRG